MLSVLLFPLSSDISVFSFAGLPPFRLFFAKVLVLGCAVVGLGVVLVGSALIRGIDRKTLVAYSSVLHISVGLVAWARCSTRGWYGVLYSNVAHTILRPMIFLGVSIFYGIQGGRDRSTIRG